MLPLALAGAILIGDPFPVVTLRALHGEPVALPGAQRGHLIVVDFFATWCGPCRQSLPALERVRLRFAPRHVAFVSIDEDAEPGAVRRFLAEVGFSPDNVLLDPDRSLFARLGAQRLPTTYVIDRRGVVRKINHGTGPGFEARLGKWLEALLRAEHE